MASAVRWAWRLVAAVSAAMLACALVYVVLAFRTRVLDGSEGNILFDAARIREKLPLYVDPVKGAWEYGPVPSRYYVLYTPTFAWLLSLVPARMAEAVARGLPTLAWYGLLAGIASRAPRELRAQAWMAAAFVGGVYTLTLYGSCARPDALALLLAGMALARSVSRGRVGPLEAALFAIAPFVKPNVIALAGGAMLAEMSLRKKHALVPVGVALATGLACAAILQLSTGGAWLVHLGRSTYGAMHLDFWLEQLSSRLQFFGLPLLFAGYCAFRVRREDGAKIALFALGSACVWTTFQLAKAGSASNYWMEPMVAFTVILAAFERPRLSAERELALSAVAVLQAFWTGVGSVRSSFEAIADAPQRAAALASARPACGARAGELVLGESPGLEYELNGRIVETPVQMTYLSRVGAYPAELWLGDVKRPEIVGIVMETDLLDKPLSEVDAEDDLFPPPLRAALNGRFVRVATAGGLRVYCERGRPGAAARETSR